MLAEVDQNIEPNQSYPEFVASLEEAEKVLQRFEKTNVSRFSCRKSPKDLEVHVCHVSMVNRKLEAGPSHGLG